MDLTPEQAKVIETIAKMMAPKSADTAVLHNHIVAARDYAVKSIAEMTAVLGPTTGGDTMPTVTDTVTVPADQWPKPDPIVPEPEPEPEKKSGWKKVGGFFKKVWPVASIALVAAVPGGAAIAAAVNAVAGAGTADPVTAGAAGLLVPIGAAIVKGMEKPKE